MKAPFSILIFSGILWLITVSLPLGYAADLGIKANRKGDQIELSWSSAASYSSGPETISYQIQQTEDLVRWTPVGTPILRKMGMAGEVLRRTVNSSARLGFYRLVAYATTDHDPVGGAAMLEERTNFATTDQWQTTAAAKPGTVLWTSQIWSRVQSCPAVGADGTVYVGAVDFKIYAINGATGQKQWEFQTGSFVYGAPAIADDGTIYVGSLDQKVYALDSSTGQKKWEFQTEGGVYSSVAIRADGRIYVVAGDATLYALDGGTGKKVAGFTSSGTYSSSYSPVIGGDGTVYVTGGYENIDALDGDTGRKKWTFQGGTSSPAIGADGTLYVGSWRGQVSALDGVNGQKKWEFSTRGYMVDSSPVIGIDGTIYVPAFDKVYAVDNITGQMKWEFNTGSFNVSSPAVGIDGTIYVSTAESVFALDGLTGQKEWTFQQDPWRRPRYYTSPAIGTDGTIYIGTSDQLVIALSSKSMGGLTPSPWPKSCANARNTSSIVQPAAGSPVIMQQPAVTHVLEHASATLSVYAAGSEPFYYQWFFEGVPVPGATNYQLKFANVQFTNTGNYFVTVSNSLGIATSRIAGLTVGYGLMVTNRGAGTIVISPAFAAYERGSRVVLNAVPGYGRTFLKWSGDVVSESNPLVVTVDRPLNIVAEFSFLPGELIWTFKTASWIQTCPAIGPDGTVYFGSDDGKVYALDGASGLKKWEFLTGFAVDSSPALGNDGSVYIGSGDGKVYALDGTTGHQKWALPLGSAILSSPAVKTFGRMFVRIYVGCSSGKVVAIDGASGQAQWEFLTGSRVMSSPALGTDGIVYFGSADHKVYALDGDTGHKKWEFLTGGVVGSSPAIGADNTVYIGSDDMKVYALQGGTGRKKWEFKTGSFVRSSPAIGDNGTVYVGSEDNKVYALNGWTGHKQWEFLTGSPVYSSPLAGIDGTIYVGSCDGWIYALNGATGEKHWQFLTGDMVLSSPAIGVDGTLYIGSRDQKLYALGSGNTRGLAQSSWPKFHADGLNTGWMTKLGPFQGGIRVALNPESQTAMVGANVTFRVLVTGSFPMSFQWQKNGSNLSDSKAAWLTLTNVQLGDAGQYQVAISNVFDMAMSTSALLTVLPDSPSETHSPAPSGCPLTVSGDDRTPE